MKHLLIPLMVGVGLTAIVAGCGIKNNTITRKVEFTNPERYEVWVEFNNSTEFDIIKYPVDKSYYDSCQVGDSFDTKYAIGEGETEFDATK